MTLDDEQAEIEEDGMTLVDEIVADEDVSGDASIDDENINDDAASDSERDNISITDSDDSEYIIEESRSDQICYEDSRSEAEEARPVRVRVPPRNYRPSFGGKTYSLLAMQHPINHAAQRHLYTRAVYFMFNQMHASRCIKLFKERAVAAMLKEYKVDSAINSVEKEFPGLVVQKGNELNFLGVEINHRDDGKVNVGTVSFLQKTVQELEEDILLPLGNGCSRLTRKQEV